STMLTGVGEPRKRLGQDPRQSARAKTVYSARPDASRGRKATLMTRALAQATTYVAAASHRLSAAATTTKNPAKAKEARTMPRNNCWVATAPACRCVKPANTVANTGNGDKRPLTVGPNTAAVPVRR